jgi:uncharacterized YkwD family protein
MNIGGLNLNTEKGERTMKDVDEVSSFTSDIRGFLKTASANGEIAPKKIQKIIGILENAKRKVASEGKTITPIENLIHDLKPFLVAGIAAFLLTMAGPGAGLAEASTPYANPDNYATGYSYRVQSQPVSTTPTKISTPRPAAQVSNKDKISERAMLNLVNKERAAAGRKPLVMDPKLTRLAEMKAQDMITNNYFGHTSPTYGTPFDMMKKNGVSYTRAGENLAGGPNVKNAHTNLMNSPKHRANILSPRFKKIGIGVVKGGPYGKIYVQQFTG